MAHNRDFKGVWIPANIWLTNELSLTEKVFLAEIDSLDNEKGCWANNEYFAEFFDMSKKQAQRIITSLIEKGFVTSEIDKEAGNKRIMRVPIPKNGDRGIPKNGDRVGTEMGIGYSQKWGEAIPKNGKHNNTSNNTINNTASAKGKNSARTQKNDFNISSNSQNATNASSTPPFFTPAKNDVVEYFVNAGASKESGERFFNQFEAVNWTSKGEKITKWQNLADSWVKNEPNMKNNVEHQSNKSNVKSYANEKYSNNTNKDEVRKQRIANLARKHNINIG